ncbi:MAG: ABC transporter permease subunit, partial [Patescibacteria group bacterium]|nr:ABC transporter permease subunit [Patescibacteria group bacterium]
MWTVFWRTIKDRRVLLLIYCLASVALLWMYIALFPAFKEQSASMEQLIKSYPESFMKAFNFDIKSFTTLEGYLSTEQFSFMWPIMTIFMLVGFAGAALAGEIESGTIEVLLSQPLSRMKLFISRYLVGFTMLVIFVAISIFAAIPLSEAYNISFKTENFVTVAILGFMFGLSIFSIAMFLSSIFSDKGKVFFITGGLLIVMYVLNILAAIKESLSDLKYASFFYYFNPSKALIYNQIDHWSYLVFLG